MSELPSLRNAQQPGLTQAKTLGVRRSCPASDPLIRSLRLSGSRPRLQEVLAFLFAEDPRKRRGLPQNLTSLSLFNRRSKRRIHAEIDQLLPLNDIRQGGQVHLFVLPIQCLLNEVEQLRVAPDLLHHQAVQRQAFPVNIGWAEHAMNLQRPAMH